MTSRTDCVYCRAPFTEANPPTRDRKDSSLGYDAPHNVVLACRDCNMIKNAVLTYDEMLIVGALIAELKAKRTKDDTTAGTQVEHIIPSGGKLLKTGAIK